MAGFYKRDTGDFRGMKAGLNTRGNNGSQKKIHDEPASSGADELNQERTGK